MSASAQSVQSPTDDQREAFVKQGEDIDKADLELNAMWQDYLRNKDRLRVADQQGYPEHEKDNIKYGMQETYEQMKGRLVMLSAQLGEIQRFKTQGAQHFLTAHEKIQFYNNEIKAKRIMLEWQELVRYR